jgi:iron complex outermembrane receptor protein
MYSKIYVWIAILCGISLSAQNSINGVVTDANKQPINNATVYFPQLEVGTLTDFDGAYSISNIPNGAHNIVISVLGYQSISEKINFTSEIISRDFQLTEKAIEMGEVIISTPFHKLQGDNVMKVERISAQDLKREGAINLSNSITSVPGVEAISTGVAIGKPVIRGLSANRVLTYSQGVRLENQQFGDEHGLGVSGNGVESIEIIKGPASLLYGSDALGGVLYINPESFATRGETHADAGYSYSANTLGSSLNGGVQTSGEKLKFLARIGYATHSDYKTGADYRVTNSRYQDTDFKWGTRYQSKSLKTTLRYNLNQAQIGIPEELGEQTTTKTPDAPFQKIDNHILSLDNTLYLNKGSIDAKLGYIYNDRSEFEEAEEEGPALRLKLNTLNYDVKYNFAQLGRLEAIAGVQGMYQTNENTGEEILIPDATTQDFGIFGMTHYHLKKIDIQVGVRYDTRTLESKEAGSIEEGDFRAAFDRNFNSLNLALGTRIDVTEKVVARVNIASGFRAPNLAELASNGVHEGTNRYEIGNSNLNNEQNFQIDVATEYGSEHLELFVNGFYNRINDYIFITPTGGVIEDNFVYNYIQDDAALYGGEVGLHYHPHPLDWLHLESSFETVTGEQNNGNSLPLIPSNKWTNSARIEFETLKDFNDVYGFIKMASYFKQDQVSDFETQTDGYNLMSLGLGASFDLDKFTVDSNLSVTNIFDTQYISHLSRLKPDGIFDIGRNINLQMQIKF